VQCLAKSFGQFATVCLLVLLAQAQSQAHAGGPFGASADDVTLTEYDDVQPIAKIHIGRVFIDHEKYGFFRFGLAPLAVGQGVQLRIQSARCLTNALASLNSWNHSSGNLRRLELRDLEISLFGDTEPRLRAATARASSGDTWDLGHASVGGAAPAVISKATLQISGPQAGHLRWHDGNQEHDLFLLKPSEPSKP